jgi:predicted porin
MHDSLAWERWNLPSVPGLAGENTMIKKILPTMIGAALAGGMTVASADITVFGHLDVSTDFTDQDGGSDAQNLNCNRCSLGFKGSEDLGNGLKAIFKLDYQFDMTERNNGNVTQSKNSAVTAVDTRSEAVEGVTKIDPVLAVTNVTTKRGDYVTNVNGSPDSITDRDQWLGLAGNFGKVRIGTISTVYKSHGAMIDPYYRTAQQQRDRGLQSDLHRGAGEEGQGRAENTFRYDSPSWNGLQLGATYTMQTDTGSSTDTPYGVGAQYKNGPFLVFADYISSDAGGDDSAYKVGGKYELGMLSFLAQYEVDDGLISARGGNQTGGKGDGADTWMLGASATMGNAMAYFGYGQGEDGGSGSMASKYEVWQLMASYNFSKRTMLYTGFSEIDCDRADNNVCSRVKSNGGEDDKFSVGMKHKF